MYLITSPNDIPYILSLEEARNHLSNNGFSEFSINLTMEKADQDGKFVNFAGYCVEKMPYDIGVRVNGMTILSYEYTNDDVYAKVMNTYSNLEYIKISELPKKQEEGSCKHTRKYLNKFQTFQFWVCPDCKQEVEGV